mgnify:CR=1 FL=1
MMIVVVIGPGTIIFIEERTIAENPTATCFLANYWKTSPFCLGPIKVMSPGPQPLLSRHI